LAALKAEEGEKLQRELKSLEAMLLAAQMTALDSASAAARLSQEAAVQSEAMKGKADVEVMRLSMLAAVAAAESARDQAKADLASVEERWIKLKDEALKSLHTLKEAEKEKAVGDVRLECKALLDAATAEKQEYLELYSKENKARKAIHNKLLELQGNIRVICRVRPILEVERRSGEDVDVTSYPSEEVRTCFRYYLCRTDSDL
jgi:kinesin family member C2/C3